MCIYQFKNVIYYIAVKYRFIIWTMQLLVQHQIMTFNLKKKIKQQSYIWWVKFDPPKLTLIFLDCFVFIVEDLELNIRYVFHPFVSIICIHWWYMTLKIMLQFYQNKTKICIFLKRIRMGNIEHSFGYHWDTFLINR